MPIIIPACVIAGVVIVGDIEKAFGPFGPTDRSAFGRSRARSFLREAKVEHLDGAVLPYLDVGRLQIAVDDPLVVRRFQGLGDLLRDRQCFVERDRAVYDPLRRSSPSTSSITRACRPEISRPHRSRRCADDSVTRASSSAFEPRQAFGVRGEGVRQDLDGDLATERRVRGPVNTCPMPPSLIAAVIS